MLRDIVARYSRQGRRGAGTDQGPKVPSPSHRIGVTLHEVMDVQSHVLADADLEREPQQLTIIVLV